MCRDSGTYSGKTVRFVKTNKPKHANARPYKRSKNVDWLNNNEDYV